MSKKQPLVNATEIIERFGGIRPMAAKIDTPVTTVQGWKKRNVIPGTRRAQILSAALDNNIDISDLENATISSAASNENLSKKPTKKPRKSNKKTVSKVASSVPSASSSDFKAVESKAEEAVEIKAEETPLRHDLLMSEIEENNRKNVVTSTWVATGLILLAIVVGFFLLWPNFKKNKEALEEQSHQLVNLENEVKEVQTEREGNFLGTSFPDGLQQKFDGLQNQARNISVTVEQLSERAKAISMEALGDSSKAIAGRLEILENKVEEITGPDGSFAGLIARIRGLEDTVSGQAQLENSADQLRSIVGGINEDGTVNQDLANAQSGEVGGALGRTLEGVAGSDLKAAAILIAFSQFRSSLEREAPFEEDLALLQKLVGDDNLELQENLTRLSEHANGGVLTASGLSKELKKLTGDIVVSSLKGEDVSIKEKAKARFGAIIQIEKDGEMVSGTKTQATVAKAQEYVEEGKVEDSISALQGLDGMAAEMAQPFIDKAEASLLADKVKGMLNQVILSKTGDTSGELLNGFQLPDINMDEVKQNLENAAPNIGQNEVIKDEESGLIILPRSSGFKGFSGPNYE